MSNILLFPVKATSKLSPVMPMFHALLALRKTDGVPDGAPMRGVNDTVRDFATAVVDTYGNAVDWHNHIHRQGNVSCT